MDYTNTHKKKAEIYSCLNCLIFLQFSLSSYSIILLWQYMQEHYTCKSLYSEFPIYSKIRLTYEH